MQSLILIDGPVVVTFAAMGAKCFRAQNRLFSSDVLASLVQ